MAKYKVIIDRDACIACGVCASLCPDVFELSSEDGKSQIVESLREAGNIGVGIIDENLKECVSNAADSCPVGAIKIEEVK